MSDLTTLATLQRALERALGRLMREAPDGGTGLRALRLLRDEVKAEHAAKPPHVLADVKETPARRCRPKPLEYGWETVDESGIDDTTERLAVPGGWLYRTVMLGFTENLPDNVALVFVPNPLETNRG